MIVETKIKKSDNKNMVKNINVFVIKIFWALSRRYIILKYIYQGSKADYNIRS